MPGRTPAEAFRAFIDPISEAASCLGQVKVTPSAGGRTEPGGPHAWSLNQQRGVALPDGWHFEAQMHYEIVRPDEGDEWRVRTLGYRYRLARLGTHVWRIHWHPTVTSGYHLPHLHLNLVQPDGGEGDTMSQHRPTGRMTFEDALDWVFNAPIQPARSDWREVLSASRDVHVQHRSWHDRPPA